MEPSHTEDRKASVMSREYVPEQIDPVSGLPTSHLSFIIKTYLPKRHIGFQRTRQNYDAFKDKFGDVADNFQMEAVMAGSMAEGFFLPNTIVKESNTAFDLKKSKMLFSDIDMLWIPKTKKIAPENLAEKDLEGYHSVMETKFTHPGYLRVRLIHPENTDADVKVFDGEMGCFYLGSLGILSSGSLSTLKTFSNVIVGTQGPSIALEDSREILTGNYREIQPDIDNVISIRCPKWPPEADEYLTRERPSGWPGSEMVGRIEKMGCCVVPTAYKKSKRPEIEWRLSFCELERHLAIESVTDAQRRGYIFLKILHHQTLKPHKLISSYLMKNIFLHSCEIIPVSEWEVNVGACVLYMLDELKTRLETRYFPHYFVRENNMIDHLEDDEITLMEAIVLDLRVNIVEIFLSFTDKYLPGHAIIAPSYRVLFEPILDDAENFKAKRDSKDLVFEVFFPSGSMVAQSCIRETKILDAVDVYADLHRLMLSAKIIDMDFAQFLVLQLKYMKTAKEMVDVVMVALEEFKEDECSRNMEANAACLWHSYACSLEDTSSEKAEALSRAETLFRSVLASGKATSNNILDFATFLFQQGRFEEALPQLHQLLDLEKKEQTATVFLKVEYPRLDAKIRDMTGNSDMFKILTSVYIYYLLILCKVKMSGGETVDMEACDEMKRVCEKDGGKYSYLLLAALLHTLNRDDEAEEYKRKASSD